MSQVNYKSTRLLIEAVNQEMESVRKAAMGNMVLGSLNDLRDLVAQLAKKAERLAIDDVRELPAPEYVATMKPLVADYHRQLMAANQLAPCLCMDLRSIACIVILVGPDGHSSVRAAHDPDRPDAALVVETLLASLDGGSKLVALLDAAALRDQALAGVDRATGEPPQYETVPLTLETMKAALNAAIPRVETTAVAASAMPCQGEHEEPCGADDCYVLASIKRNAAPLPDGVELCSGCDCVAGECDCAGCDASSRRLDEGDCTP